MKKNFIKLSLVAVLLCANASASLTSSTTGFSGAHGKFNFGGISIKNNSRLSPISVASLQAPSVQAGCSGININKGGFGFISLDDIVDNYRSILGAAAGYAFNLALSTFCKTCQTLMDNLQSIANAINSLSMDSCAAGKALGEYGVKVIGNAFKSGNEGKTSSPQKTKQTAVDNFLNEATDYVIDKVSVIDEVLNPGSLLGNGEVSHKFKLSNGIGSFMNNLAERNWLTADDSFRHWHTKVLGTALFGDYMGRINEEGKKEIILKSATINVLDLYDALTNVDRKKEVSEKEIEYYYTEVVKKENLDREEERKLTRTISTRVKKIPLDFFQPLYTGIEVDDSSTSQGDDKSKGDDNSKKDVNSKNPMTNQTLAEAYTKRIINMINTMAARGQITSDDFNLLIEMDPLHVDTLNYLAINKMLDKPRLFDWMAKKYAKSIGEFYVAEQIKQVLNEFKDSLSRFTMKPLKDKTVQEKIENLILRMEIYINEGLKELDKKVKNQNEIIEAINLNAKSRIEQIKNKNIELFGGGKKEAKDKGSKESTNTSNGGESK